MIICQYFWFLFGVSSAPLATYVEHTAIEWLSQRSCVPVSHIATGPKVEWLQVLDVVIPVINRRKADQWVDNNYRERGPRAQHEGNFDEAVADAGGRMQPAAVSDQNGADGPYWRAALGAARGARFPLKRQFPSVLRQ